MQMQTLLNKENLQSFNINLLVMISRNTAPTCQKPKEQEGKTAEASSIEEEAFWGQDFKESYCSMIKKKFSTKIHFFSTSI